MLKKLQEAFEERYRICPLTQEDVPAVLKLYQSNEEYYTVTQNHPVSVKDCIHDMTECPPGTAAEQKYYLGYYQKENLTAVMDFVDGYPDRGTVYIGLFIIDRAFHGTGTGTAILSPFLAAMKELGYQRVQLGCFESNAAGKKFWTKLGFTVDETVDRTEEETCRRLMKMSLPL